MMEVPLLNSELVVTVVDVAWRIDATSPVICSTATGNKQPVKDTEMGGIDDLDAAAEVARG